MDLKVLYEDNHLIAVFKPEGMLVQADITRDKCLMDFVKQYLQKKYDKPGKVFLGLLHRLDRPVSGIVLFAKTSKGASRISEQIRNRTIEKKYSALVSGQPTKMSDRLEHYLVKNESKNKVWAHLEPVENGIQAILEYEVKNFDGQFSTVKINLITGRHHQIRAQMASIGCPIVGDSKYGSKIVYKEGKGICLCADYLRFKMATKDEWVEIAVSPDYNLGK